MYIIVIVILRPKGEMTRFSLFSEIVPAKIFEMRHWLDLFTEFFQDQQLSKVAKVARQDHFQLFWVCSHHNFF